MLQINETSVKGSNMSDEATCQYAEIKYHGLKFDRGDGKILTVSL